MKGVGHCHEEFTITLYKNHDEDHPLFLTLSFSPQADDPENNLYTTCPSSTVICSGKAAWFNAYTPRVVATAKVVEPDEKTTFRDTSSCPLMEVDLTLDFANRRTEATKWEDPEDTWDGNAYLQLRLANISKCGSVIRRGFFKNSDLEELDVCYRAEISRESVEDVSSENCDAANAKVMLVIHVEYEEDENEQKERENTNDKKEEEKQGEEKQDAAQDKEGQKEDQKQTDAQKQDN